MKTFIKLFLIAILFCYSAVAIAQPTITFTPSSGTTLTREDVLNSLAANGLGPNNIFNVTVTFSGSPFVTSFIGDSAFSKMGVSICNILAPVEIGRFAFAGCINLSHISALATTIGDSAFRMSNISNANFQQALHIGVGAFDGCSDLTTINFPLVKTIGDGAFDECGKLTALNFPSVTAINTNTF